MVVTFNIRVEDRGFKRLVKNFGPRVMKNMNRANFEFAKLAASSVKAQLLAQQKLAPRKGMASRIMGRKISSREVGIFMPLSAHFLDSMRPHYVSLERGRNITKWTRKYYSHSAATKFGKTGRSRVRKDPRGGIKGFLYVTPDPFFERGFNKVRNKHRTLLQKAIRKTIRGG